MSPFIDQHRGALASLCRRYGVARLRLFLRLCGHGTVRPSDLDFAEALEELFGREVDLVTERSVQHPHFRRAVESAQQLASKPLTVEAYPARDRDAGGRLEFLNGTITDVAGAEPQHSQAKNNMPFPERLRAHAIEAPL